MSTLRFLGICGSLRRQSRNSGLLRAAMSMASADVRFSRADISQVPFYNADVAAVATPPSVAAVFGQMAEADALVLACPEYNYSLAPALKNILDWASREPGNPLLAGKPVAILGAGGGMGSARSQYHLRQVCVYLDMHPLNKPEVFSNAFSPSFNEDGDLVDEHIAGLVKELMTALEAWTRRLKA
ncbi:NADPH-dependent FMN reductase [Fundidesulfovibrio agrisoli]|uniref:NADPH-dependent FMN reductase n=1 Tax=Fundidesulfovibrio agrisoli TaxID=2922717 RepID=UPI001FAE3237|nr:NADPH-dependent FMN reductase [Fundidesulfovibrio agrisoli]